jgi:hypothetical protein
MSPRSAPHPSWLHHDGGDAFAEIGMGTPITALSITPGIESISVSTSLG